MNTDKDVAKSNRSSNRQHKIKLISIPTLGVTLLVLGVAGGILAYIAESQGWQLSGIFGFLFWYLTNLSGELSGIAITILIVDWIYDRRAKIDLRASLIRQMGNPDQGIALQAIKDLDFYGWLKDGSLRGARLENANLQGAYLVAAELPEVVFYQANLGNCILYNANLSQANLMQANLDNANLMFVNLEQAKCRGASLTGTGLRGANLVGASLSSASLKRASLRDANLTGANLEEAALDGAILWGTNLTDAKNLTDDQLRRVDRLWQATMPDGKRYNGRFNLPGDIEVAKERGVDLADHQAVADFYGVSLETYLKGQAP